MLTSGRARRVSVVLLAYKKNIVCSLSHIGWPVHSLIYASSVAEQVAVLVLSFRQRVVQADRIDAQLWQCMHFLWLRDAIVICVHPQAQRGKDFVSGINHAVAVAAIHWIVVDGQCGKSIGVRRYGLRREIAKQLSAVRYRTAAVAIQREESVIRVRGPCHVNRNAIVGKIKRYSVRRIGKREPIACHINDDGRDFLYQICAVSASTRTNRAHENT
jgi:hypothetical protein